MGKPGLSVDAASLYRPLGADEDGNPVSTMVVVWEGKGRYGTPRAVDVDRAGKIGQQVDAMYAVEALRGTFKPDDTLELRGLRWRVLSETDVRIHLRVALRRIE